MGFDLWDEQTVKRLLTEQPDLMPYYPPEKAVKRGIDLKWGKQQIAEQVTSGILQGESVKHLADRLQKNIPDMNRNSAIRSARTAVTGAQNAGRMASYDAAEKMGIKLKKEWLATLNGRTRHSHAVLDGEKAEKDKKFSNGCMFPGDPNGPASEIYNCRCTLIASMPDVDTSDAQRRARDPVTGEQELIPDMTYSEWIASKRKQYGDETVDAAIKSIKNEGIDNKQFRNYKERLGKDAPKSLAEFQKIKYNNSDKYQELKDMYRYKGRVPEATKQDFEKYRAVKATGTIGTVRVPPYPIDSSKLELKDAHALRHGCTIEDARRYVDNAKCSIRRKKWDGFHTNYYSLDGATYIHDATFKVNTAFSEAEFDPDTKNIVEVFK